MPCRITPSIRQHRDVGKVAALGFGTAVPFGLNARQMESWLVHVASFSRYGIPMGNIVARWASGFGKKSTRSRILQGLKFRIGGFTGKVVSKLGVVPQQLAPGDIYSALEMGTLDAVEWIGPADDEKVLLLPGLVRG